jgi:hypothetical protein
VQHGPRRRFPARLRCVVMGSLRARPVDDLPRAAHAVCGQRHLDTGQIVAYSFGKLVPLLLVDAIRLAEMQP